jgi:hypothetical protein
MMVPKSSWSYWSRSMNCMPGWRGGGLELEHLMMTEAWALVGAGERDG